MISPPVFGARAPGAQDYWMCIADRSILECGAHQGNVFIEFLLMYGAFLRNTEWFFCGMG
jgi:hypothetical protein